MSTSRRKPPPSPAVAASTITANTSSSLRTPTSAPVSANTKMPSRSRATSRTPGCVRSPVRSPLMRPVCRPTCAADRPPPLRDGGQQVGSRGEPDEGAGDPMKEQDLTLVGLTEDQQKLVLVSDAGEEFTLPADARLRAALRGEHARLGQLEITMESSLRPRDIQARIRAGA